MTMCTEAAESQGSDEAHINGAPDKEQVPGRAYNEDCDNTSYDDIVKNGQKTVHPDHPGRIS